MKCIEPIADDGDAMVDVDVGVHRYSVAGEESSVWRYMYEGELVLEIFRVFDIRRDQVTKALEVEINPCTNVGEK